MNPREALARQVEDARRFFAERTRVEGLTPEAERLKADRKHHLDVLERAAEALRE